MGEKFGLNEAPRKLVPLQRAFRLTGAPFILPPGTPRDRVEILKEAFRKTYRDPEFHYVLEFRQLRQVRHRRISWKGSAGVLFPKTEPNIMVACM